METISSHMTVARSFSEAFVLKNRTAMIDSLVEAGMTSEAAEVMVDGFVNINRVTRLILRCIPS